MPAERVLAAADFYVLPSYEECLSLVLQDALIMGLPAVGTDAGGTPALVRPEITGVLVPPRDAGALAKAMERLYIDPASRARWGQEASKLADTLDEKRVVSEILAAYSR
jgi:glycosyltransferase involved in cell wall biosynthesis